MELEKKRILKSDGRYIVYYHFPATATEAQTAAYSGAEAAQAAAADAAKAATSELTTEKHQNRQ